jgi:asparagine synthase (glutamine-hydrolysing)
MERPKMGFGIPIESWLQNELKELVQENLSEAALKKHGLFNSTEVKKLTDQLFNGRPENHLKVWYLLQFQMWYQRWVG